MNLTLVVDHQPAQHWTYVPFDGGVAWMHSETGVQGRSAIDPEALPAVVLAAMVDAEYGGIAAPTHARIRNGLRRGLVGSNQHVIR